jgi:ADP-ribose pyrophosphatase YjhB (NUDIX family)
VIPDVTRPCAFVFIRERDRMLVARMTDPGDGVTFFRPLGGGIEFGEVAIEAARREIREELGVGIRRIRHLGVLENVFTYDGRDGHEIAFVLEAEPDGWSIDAFDGYAVPESVNAGGDETAVVLDIAAAHDVLLYPEGVSRLLLGPRGLRAAAAAVLLDDRILLSRRRDDGTWEMPGGGTERNESPWDTAARECVEECGVVVTPRHVVGIYHNPALDLTVTVVACAWTSGEPVPTDEADAGGWFAPGALPEPIRDVVRERVGDAIAGERGLFRSQTA